MSAALDPRLVPRFTPGTRFRFDETRQAWVLLAPERLFLPDEHAVAVLELIDNVRTVADITSALAERFAVPAETIAADIGPMLQDLESRGALRLTPP